MDILIVEEGLYSLHGHYYQYIYDLVGGLERQGHRCHVLVPLGASPVVLRDLPAHCVLRCNVHTASAVGSLIARLGQVLHHNRQLEADVSMWLESTGLSFDLTIFPSTRVEQIGAIDRLLRRWPRRLGRVVTMFIDAVGVYTADGGYRFPKRSLLFKCAIRRLRMHHSERTLCFCAESAQMAAQFESFSGCHFHCLPHVCELPRRVFWRGGTSGELGHHLVFATFGFGRFDKGLDILQDAIPLLPQQIRRTHRFLIQWTGDYGLPDGRIVVRDPALLDAEDVTYLEQFSDSKAYHQWLCRVDAIILPYRQSFYRERMSRVAVDAAQAGLPMVYPRGTWIESFVAVHGAGVPFTPGDHASLALAIVQLSRSFDSLIRLASSRRAAVREAFSASEFLRCIATFLPSR